MQSARRSRRFRVYLFHGLLNKHTKWSSLSTGGHSSSSRSASDRKSSRFSDPKDTVRGSQVTHVAIVQSLSAVLGMQANAAKNATKAIVDENKERQSPSDSVGTVATSEVTSSKRRKEEDDRHSVASSSSSRRDTKHRSSSRRDKYEEEERNRQRSRRSRSSDRSSSSRREKRDKDRERSRRDRSRSRDDERRRHRSSRSRDRDSRRRRS